MRPQDWYGSKFLRLSHSRNIMLPALSLSCFQSYRYELCFETLFMFTNIWVQVLAAQGQKTPMFLLLKERNENIILQTDETIKPGKDDLENLRTGTTYSTLCACIPGVVQAYRHVFVTLQTHMFLMNITERCSRIQLIIIISLPIS